MPALAFRTTHEIRAVIASKINYATTMQYGTTLLPFSQIFPSCLEMGSEWSMIVLSYPSPEVNTLAE